MSAEEDGAVDDRQVSGVQPDRIWIEPVLLQPDVTCGA